MFKISTYFGFETKINEHLHIHLPSKLKISITIILFTRLKKYRNKPHINLYICSNAISPLTFNIKST